MPLDLLHAQQDWFIAIFIGSEEEDIFRRFVDILYVSFFPGAEVFMMSS